jgi:HSP20 family protein
MKLMKRPTLFPTMSSLFDDFFNRDLFDWTQDNFSTTNTTIPAVNIRETPDEFIVEMAAPGMRKEDFQIELKDNLLTICSEYEHEEELGEEERYKRREFSYQSFERSFRLNQNVVDEKKINANYQNGVLHLHIPKKEEAKARPPRQIKVS